MATRLPKYSLHKATGLARVAIDGRDHYLGPYDSDASRAEYSRLIDAWRLRRKARRNVGLTIGELVLLYDAHVASYYVKNGKPTSEQHIVRSALRPLVGGYSRVPAIDFGPRDLKAIREKYVARGYSRGTVNAYARRIVALFKWAVSEEFVPVDVHAALATVAGLRKGRSKAPERPPVRPVPEEDINAILPLVSRQVKAMIMLQAVAGMRPGEVCSIRPSDVNRDGDVWEYRPQSHKTEHHDRPRVIFLGPKAQRILSRWLDNRPAEAFCFSPAEAERERLAALHATRKTPLSCGNSPGANRVGDPSRQPGDCYTTATYGRCIARTCKAVNETRDEMNANCGEGEAEQPMIEVWSPNRLRHSRATDLRKMFGIEAAGVVLGHAKLSTTELYAEVHLSKAREIMGAVG